MACIRDDLSNKPEVICIPCNTPMWLVNTFHHQWSGSYFPVFQPGMDLTLLARLLLTYFIVYMITKLMHVRIFDLMCRFWEICVYIVDLSIEEEVWEDKLFCIVVLFNWGFCCRWRKLLPSNKRPHINSFSLSSMITINPESYWQCDQSHQCLIHYCSSNIQLNSLSM